MLTDDTLEHWLNVCGTYTRDVTLAHLDAPLGETRQARLGEALTRALESCSIPALTELQSQVEATPVEQRDAAQRVYAWAVGIYLQGQVQPQARAMYMQQSQLTCRVDDEIIPVMSSFAHMAGETRRDRRHAIEAAVADKLGTLDDVFQSQFDGARDAALQLSYTSLDHMWGEVKGVDLDAQQDLVTELLEETRVTYVDLLNWAAQRRLRLPAEQLRRHDILSLFTLPDYQKYYQPDFAVPSLQACLQDLGIDPYANGRLDWRERSATFGVAEALAPQLPDEVVLSHSAVFGLQGAQQFASAAGLSLSWAYASASTPQLYRLLLDPSLSIGHGQLFADMITNPYWLRQYGRFNVDADYLAWLRLNRLYQLRRQCGRFLYARHLCTSESLADAPAAYRDIMMEACHIDYAPAYYLTDWDWQYSSLTLWRGWSLTYALGDALHDHFAHDWFRNPEAGEWLLQYWSEALVHRVDTILPSLLGRDWEVSLFAEALCEERVD